MPETAAAASGRQAGMILLPVILLLLMLATAATAMTLQARTSLREASTRQTRLRLGLLAEGAVRATGLALTAATANRAAPPFALDGTPQTCRLDDGTRLTLAVQDEGGRVDLNKATPDLLLRILAGAGVSGPQANAVAEAIQIRRGSKAAPPAHAASRARPEKSFAIPSGGFATADEIDGLPGVEPALFERLRPLFTVANGSAGIDPAVAAPAVRAVIPPKELTSPALEPLTTPSNHSDFVVVATLGIAGGAQVQRAAGLHIDPRSGPMGHVTSWDAPATTDPPPAVLDGPFCQRVAAVLGQG